MNPNDKLGRMWKESIVAYFTILINSLIESIDLQRKLKEIFSQKFEPAVSRI
jgi:hypothetical protein